MLVEMKEIKFKELTAAVNVLNASGLLASNIQVVGSTKEAIVKAFVKAVQSVPDDPKTGDWTGPGEVADYYGKIVLQNAKKDIPPAAKKSSSAKPPKKDGKDKKDAAGVGRKGIGVKAFVTGLLAGKETKNLPNAKLAEMVREKLGSNTTAACVAWYKNKAAKG